MPTYIIEREIPGAGQLTDDELRGITTTSNDVGRVLRGRTRGATATSRATRSTASTRPRTPRTSASTPAAAASRPTSWPRSRAVFDSTGPRELPV